MISKSEGSADHNDQEEPIYEYTEPWWDDSYQGWLCAASEANLQKKKKVQEELVRPHLTMSALAKERVRAKARGGLATIEASKDTLYESIQLLKGSERARTGSHRNSGRSTTLASSRSSGTTGGQEIRKARAKAQTNLMEKEV